MIKQQTFKTVLAGKVSSVEVAINALDLNEVVGNTQYSLSHRTQVAGSGSAPARAGCEIAELAGAGPSSHRPAMSHAGRG